MINEAYSNEFNTNEALRQKLAEAIEKGRTQVKAQGIKHDSGKIKAGILGEFSYALLAVAKVGTFGADKYSRGNWIHVDDATQRYTDAMWRHLLQDGNDEESGLPHFHHFVWNALAVLQLDKQVIDGDSFIAVIKETVSNRLDTKAA